MIHQNEASRSSNHEESDFAFDFQFAFCIFYLPFFRSHAMIFPTCITHGSRFVQKWKIVEIDRANGLTFDCIFNLFKQGSVAGIAPFPWPLEDGNFCNDLKDFQVILPIFMGKYPDSLIECGTHLEGEQACKMFGKLVKFVVKVEHPSDCICSVNETRNVTNAFDVLMQALARSRIDFPDDFPPVLLKIHSCYDPIESLYYSCGYKDYCVYCSTEDEDELLVAEDSPFLPQCRGCVEDGKSRIKRKTGQ